MKGVALRRYAGVLFVLTSSFVFGCEGLAGIEDLDDRPKRATQAPGSAEPDPGETRGASSGDVIAPDKGPTPPITPVGTLSQPHRITLGSTHSCAIVGERVQCWGSNAVGQLGKSSAATTDTGRIVPNVDHVVSISAGAAHTCAIDRDGAVFCWGRSHVGQLGGNPTDTGAAVKVDLGAGKHARQVATGTLHSCALIDQSVKCWGDNAFGQLGDGTKNPSNGALVSPVGLDGTVTAVFAAGFFTCALKTSGALSCWGDNNFGQLGDRTKTPRPSPVSVLDLDDKEKFKVVGLGQNTSCGVTTGGALYCWGRNRAVGDTISQGIVLPFQNSPLEYLTPKPVGVAPNGGQQQALLLIESISAGPNHACARSVSGNALCWGSNVKSQLGVSSSPSTTQDAGAAAAIEGFVDVAELDGAVKEISVGLTHSCALVKNDEIYCWGASDYGQAGAPVGAPHPRPARVVMSTSEQP